MPTRSSDALPASICAALAAAVLFCPAVEVVADDLAPSLPAVSDTPLLERRLVLGLEDLHAGNLESARERLESLADNQPDFRLAHLIRADLWLAQANGISQFGEGRSRDEQVVELLNEARARWRRYRDSPPQGVPKELLKLPESATSALVVDLGQNRLYVYQRRASGFERSHDYYVSIGKNGSDKQIEGDERTPVGYYVVDSYLPGETLPDLYGVGAYPISYPNGWDRLQGRTGSGIWIHGTEWNTYSRPPRSSRGCVTLANEDFRELQDAVTVGATPVLVTNGVEWTSPRRARRRSDGLETLVESWRQAWESRDTESYLSFYSPDFRSQGMDRAAFKAHKERVNLGKRFIRVRLEDVGIFEYPGEENLVVIDFVQHYESDSFRGTTRKHQYWRLEAGEWRIVLEERV